MGKAAAVLLTSDPECGGEHQYLKTIAEALAECGAGKIKLTAIVTTDYWEEWCRKNKVKFYRITLMQYAGDDMLKIAAFSRLLSVYHTFTTNLGKILRRENSDILICGQQGIFLPGFLCRTIRPVHDLMHRYEPDFPEIRSTAKAREQLFSSVVKTSDVILVDSKLGERQLRESYIGNKRKPKVRVLPFAIPDHIQNAKEEYIETSGRYIFYPAQFWAHKNHENLVKAVRIVRETIPDIHLILVGSEQGSKQRIKKMIYNMDLENNITIKGFVSDGQITYLYRHAEALIMPTYFGPTNIPPLEAMALGCPVIVSDKYAMKEQVGKAGLLCNPDSPKDMADCICRVWQNESLRKKMIAEGYIQSQKWTQKHFKKEFLRIVLED